MNNLEDIKVYFTLQCMKNSLTTSLASAQLFLLDQKQLKNRKNKAGSFLAVSGPETPTRSPGSEVDFGRGM